MKAFPMPSLIFNDLAQKHHFEQSFRLKIPNPVIFLSNTRNYIAKCVSNCYVLIPPLSDHFGSSLSGS